VLTNPQALVITTHRIEVSGWDEHEAFFVEKTELEWNEKQNTRVRLRHVLRDAAVVFVRILQNSTQAHLCPIAYQVKATSELKNSHAHEYSLTRMDPRGTLR
jgi:hypothetical protein